jgi:hypothetical protein
MNYQRSKMNGNIASLTVKAPKEAINKAKRPSSTTQAQQGQQQEQQKTNKNKGQQ